MLKQLWNDNTGFIISSELVLVSTLLIVGLFVGFSEVQHAVVSELNDVGDAVGSLNQSYSYTGFVKRSNTRAGLISASTSGSFFLDQIDDCDADECDMSCLPPTREAPKDN